MTSTGTEAFRSQLREELLKRVHENPRYSLRAFARSLALEPSLLSKLINGRRTITQSMMSRLSAKLGLDPAGFEQKLASPSRRSDEFEALSNVVHESLMCLLSMKQALRRPAYLARMLGATVVQTQDALARLLRLELVRCDENGDWSAVQQLQTLNPSFEVKEAAIQRLRRTQLRRSLEGLDEGNSQSRDYQSQTVLIDPSRVPELRSKIQAFTEELKEWISNHENPSQVFHIGHFFVPLSRPVGSEEF